METKYSLTSDIDPKDEQLEELMQAVLMDVKERARVVAINLKNKQEADLKIAKEKWQYLNIEYELN